ncbi:MULTISPECIES: thioredoxin [unclassified Romboutsia]|uniref:thioredoxin n=1 Tax=unclassified Romboutsia TaxID=2626894 RepID=UPI0008224BD9|nr:MULTISPECIES: thioredoxin [unclassified Romboutsia]SCI16474.1 Thioredoxin [uncultured Clostridium sp.]
MAKIIKTSEFRSEVEEKQGVVVVDFFATWCGPCKMLAPVFEALGEEMDGKANFYKLDVDQSLEIAQQFSVSTVPTMIIFKDGKVVDKMIGFVPKEQIKSKVESYL